LKGGLAIAAIALKDEDAGLLLVSKETGRQKRNDICK
jgi:hypothetical protein